MIHYFYSLILGVVQGITEFVPVSSSGHLVILHDLFNSAKDSLTFDIALHLGSLLAVIIFFRVEILKYIVAVLEIFIPKRKVNKEDLADAMLLIYATIPAAIVGVFSDRIIETYLRNTYVVIVTLLFGAGLFFLVEKYAKHKLDFTGMGIGKALYIGFAQVLALIPGVSRSGITIVAGMSAKLKREEAAKFSFLMSIPIILGAGYFKMKRINWNLLPLDEVIMFGIGFITSFVVGYVVIKYFLKYLKSHKLNVFAWYRIGLAIVLLIWVLIK
jgi:undecaprenyl-diphosphatase